MRLIDLRGDGALFIGYNGEYEVWVIDPEAAVDTIDAIPVEWIEQHFGSLKIAQMIIESWRAENEND